MAPLWLIGNRDRTVAVVRAGGRRKALNAYRAGIGAGSMHHSCRTPMLRDVPGVTGAVFAEPARVVDGEVVPR
jgi:hypothetical protein